jgi:hypothetical protein
MPPRLEFGEVLVVAGPPPVTGEVDCRESTASPRLCVVPPRLTLVFSVESARLLSVVRRLELEDDGPQNDELPPEVMGREERIELRPPKPPPRAPRASSS